MENNVTKHLSVTNDIAIFFLKNQTSGATFVISNGNRTELSPILDVKVNTNDGDKIFKGSYNFEKSVAD